MLKKRIIPVLFIKNGLIVRSEGFSDFRELGNPIDQLKRLNDWEVDELIYVDISRSGKHDLKRDDLKTKNSDDISTILSNILDNCFMPFCFGGKITTFEQVRPIIRNGADKVIINTGAYKTKGLIEQIANHYGSQACVVGIDVKRENGKHNAYIQQGTKKIKESPVEWAKIVQSKGAGEIFLNSIDRDGKANGYDLEIIQEIATAVNIPVIACGGAGFAGDFIEVLEKTESAAVAAGNIFNFSENAYLNIKKKLLSRSLPIRPSSI